MRPARQTETARPGLRRAARALALALAGAAAAGCGSGRNDDGSPDFSGNWAGSWWSTVSTGYEGALVARVTQSGSRISGTLQATGSPCLTFASISGTVTDREIQFDAVLGVDQMSFTATADMLELDAFGGPYSVTAGTCTGDQGMFELSR